MTLYKSQKPSTKQLSFFFSHFVVEMVPVLHFSWLSTCCISDFHEKGDPFRLVAARVGSWRDAIHFTVQLLLIIKSSLHCLERIQCLSSEDHCCVGF